MADVEQLRELLAFMRAENIQHARVGELELRLVPALPPPAAKVSVPVPVPIEAPEDDDPNAEARRSLEALLHSSGADPAPFIRAYGLEPPAREETH